jgi:hypothetical protein
MRKTIELGFLMLMVAALAFALGNSALALHDADTLKCMACHTMHASENGNHTGVNTTNGFDAAPDGGVTEGGNPALLLRSNRTDLCLARHSESGSAAPYTDTVGDVAPLVQSAGGIETTGVFDLALPGGDYWNSNQTVGGVTGARGHNPCTSDGIVFAGGISQDNAHGTTPPGGSGPLTKWDCVSCHAPHQADISESYGTANAFRMLWSQPAGMTPAVTVLALEGNLAADESDGNHSAYQNNFSAWCGQCHGDFHTEPGDAHYHPSDEDLPTAMVTNYNGNPGLGSNYSFITPVEDSSATTVDFAASANAQAICLSCHRAHSAATLADHPDYDTDPLDADAINKTKNMTRWDMTLPSGEGMGCNKCHDKGS